MDSKIKFLLTLTAILLTGCNNELGNAQKNKEPAKETDTFVENMMLSDSKNRYKNFTHENQLYLLDTATGHTWYLTNNTWQLIQGPTPPGKKSYNPNDSQNLYTK